MAYPSVSAPYGFLPINLMGGQVYAGSTRHLPIATTYGYNIGFGDPVSLASDGTIVRIDTSVNAAKAAWAVRPCGIFLGCTYTDPNLKYKVHRQYWPASTVATDAMAIVADDPDILMRVFLTNAGTAYTSSAATSADRGLNIGYFPPTTYVNTSTGNSAISGDLNAKAVTATLPLRIIDFVQETALSDGTFVEAIVKFNEGTISVATNFAVTYVGGHQYRNPTGL